MIEISDELRDRARAAVPAFYGVKVTSNGATITIDCQPPDGSPGFGMDVQCHRVATDDGVMVYVERWIAGEPWHNMRTMWPDKPWAWTTPPPTA